MSAYYNEIEPFAVQWLTNLCAAGHIPPGDVDSRSILKVQPQPLEQYDEAHFFAGIGLWARALRDAGWPTARVPVWSGSCPCQPFSAAGKQLGTADERHLWPVWFELIRSCRPPVVFGEQVASRDALAWLDVVFSDLEAEGYTCWAVDLCAAGVGAPHIRQRLWFVAIRLADAHRYLQSRDGLRAADRAAEAAAGSTSERERGEVDAGRGGARIGLADAGGVGRHLKSSAWVHERRSGASGAEPASRGADGAQRNHDAGCGIDDRLADAGDGRCPLEQHTGCCDAPPRRGQADGQSSGAGTDVWLADAAACGWPREGGERSSQEKRAAERCGVRGMADSDSDGREGRLRKLSDARRQADGGLPGHGGEVGGPGATNGAWGAADWLFCRDGKWRPVRSGTQPLADGSPGRVGRLRAYGNAICLPVATTFVKAVMEALGIDPA